MSDAPKSAPSSDALSAPESGADSFLRQVARVPDLPLHPVRPPDLGALPVIDPQRYEQRREYARGGMGRVLQVHDARLGRTVAVKELLSESPEAEERFVHEALITARLQHPSIVPVHEAGRWPDGKPFYVMKLVSGRSLSAVLRERPQLDQRLTLLPVVLAVSEAVAYAHNQGVIHRDIKAANVVVGEFGETVVIDWGLAKLLSEGPQQPRTMPGVIIGTPGFMPLEQALGEPVDERADVYALGALLYHVLAGAPPYLGTTSGELLSQVRAGPPPPLQQRQPDVPPELLAIVAQAMARAPAGRYPSAQELAADLRRFLSGHLVAAHRYSPLTLLWRWLRRHRALVAVSAAALLLSMTMTALSVRRVVRARDRAQREQERAEAARAHEATLMQDLVLAQARNRQDSDPTAALAWLKQLRPGASQWSAARAVALLASSKGVALHQWTRVTPRALAVPAPGQVLTCRADGALQAWDLRAAVPRTLPLSAAADAAPVALSADGAWLAAARDDAALALHPLRGGGAARTLRTEGAVSAVVFSASGQVLAARDARGVAVWDLATGRSQRFALPPGPGGIALSGDGQRVAAGAPGGSALWQVASGEQHWLREPGTVTLVALSPDGALLAAANADGAVRLWDIQRGQSAVYSHQGALARDLAFSADGRWLAATRGPMVRVWSLPGGEIRKLRGHSEDVERLALSADGAWLASASQDGALRLWRLRGEAPVPPDAAALPAWLGQATHLTLDPSYHLR